MYNNLDITEGFVLSTDKAIAYLEDIATQHAKEVMEGNEDPEGIEVILEELRDIKKDMERLTYEYWYIIEHPMIASGLHATPMIKKDTLQ